MRLRSASLLVAILLAGFHAPYVLAGDDCSGISAECVAVGHWNFSVALGAGVRTNPVVHGGNIPLVIIPQFSYYGKRVFIENLDLGVTLAEGNTNTVSLIGSPGYDRVFFYRSDLQNILVGGLPGASTGASATTQKPPAATQFPARPRHITYLAGAEWTFKHSHIAGQLDLLHEITGQNGGDEIRAVLAIPLIESRSSLTAGLGITWKSAAIVNYYYGAPNVYEAGAAVNPFFKLSYSRVLSGKWRLTALAHYERLGRAIGDSPIISEHYVATVFAGVTYRF